MNNASTDRIERSVVINAPRARVWRALTNAEEFGVWFGVNLKGQAFAAGQRTRGQILFKGYEHLFFDVVVDRLEPPNLMSYRWHPYAHDPNVDYSKEEPTLVTFTLKDAPGNGTLLTVVETGFDRLWPERRMEVFRMNTMGWETQFKKLVAHVES
ncbi:MAG TPA: SRPBCC family protein [Rhodanobacteraceae bacterium]